MRKKTIKVQGLRGKNFTTFPFFANDEVRSKLMAERITHKPKAKSGKTFIIRLKSENAGGGTDENKNGGAE